MQPQVTKTFFFLSILRYLNQAMTARVNMISFEMYFKSTFVTFSSGKANCFFVITPCCEIYG